MAKKIVRVSIDGQAKAKIVYEQVAPTDNSKTERRVLSPFFWNVSRGSRVNTAGRNADVVGKN
jgi:hypothetical protein